MIKIINESNSKINFTVLNRYSYNGIKGWLVECSNDMYFDKLGNIRKLSEYLNINVEMTGHGSTCIIETNLSKDKLQNLLDKYSDKL